MKRRRASLAPTPLAAFLVTLALIAAAIVASALQREPRLAATNTRVIASKLAIPLGPGERRCQSGEYVPTSATRAQIYAGFSGPQGPPLEVTLSSREERMHQRYAVTGYSASPIDVPLRPRGRDLEVAELCIRNAGGTQVTLAGNFGSDNPEAPGASNTPYQRPSDEVRVDYLQQGDKTVFDVLPAVFKRFTLFKPVGGLGPWALWMTLAILGATALGSSIIFLRAARE